MTQTRFFEGILVKNWTVIFLTVLFAVFMTGCSSNKATVLDPSVPADQCAIITTGPALSLESVNGKNVGNYRISYKKKDWQIPAGEHTFEFLYFLQSSGGTDTITTERATITMTQKIQAGRTYNVTAGTLESTGEFICVFTDTTFIKSPYL